MSMYHSLFYTRCCVSLFNEMNSTSVGSNRDRYLKLNRSLETESMFDIGVVFSMIHYSCRSNIFLLDFPADEMRNVSWVYYLFALLFYTFIFKIHPSLLRINRFTEVWFFVGNGFFLFFLKWTCSCTAETCLYETSTFCRLTFTVSICVVYAKRRRMKRTTLYNVQPICT